MLDAGQGQAFILFEFMISRVPRTTRYLPFFVPCLEYIVSVLSSFFPLLNGLGVFDGVPGASRHHRSSPRLEQWSTVWMIPDIPTTSIRNNDLCASPAISTAPNPLTAAHLIFLIHLPSYIGRQLNLFQRNALSRGLTITLGVNIHNVAGENV